MGPGPAGHVKILALASPRYDETNWWRSREGSRELAFGLLSRAYVYSGGSLIEDIEPWDPDKLEKSLAESITGEGR